MSPRKNSLKAFIRNRDTAPLILDVVCRWWWVFNATFWLFFPRERAQLPIVKEGGWTAQLVLKRMDKLKSVTRFRGPIFFRQGVTDSIIWCEIYMISRVCGVATVFRDVTSCSLSTYVPKFRNKFDSVLKVNYQHRPLKIGHRPHISGTAL